MLLSFGARHMIARVDHTLGLVEYVHDSFMVGCLSDRSINPSKGIVAYGIKGT